MNAAFRATLLMLLVVSCHTRPEGKYKYSFDDLAAYMYDQPTLVPGNAHSGLYNLMVDTNQTYGLTFRLKIGALSDKNLKGLHVSVWCKHSEVDTEGSLVCSVDSGETTVFYESVRFRGFIENSNEWALAEMSFDLSSHNDKSNGINIYPLNNGPGLVFIDDMEITVIE